jgi:hypothetical protein
LHYANTYTHFNANCDADRDLNPNVYAYADALHGKMYTNTEASP